MLQKGYRTCVSSIITLYMYNLCYIGTALFSVFAHVHERVTTTIRVLGLNATSSLGCSAFESQQYLNHLDIIVVWLILIPSFYICFICQQYILLLTF